MQWAAHAAVHSSRCRTHTLTSSHALHPPQVITIQPQPQPHPVYVRPTPAVYAPTPAVYAPTPMPQHNPYGPVYYGAPPAVAACSLTTPQQTCSPPTPLPLCECTCPTACPGHGLEGVTETQRPQEAWQKPCSWLAGGGRDTAPTESRAAAMPMPNGCALPARLPAAFGLDKLLGGMMDKWWGKKDEKKDEKKEEKMDYKKMDYKKVEYVPQHPTYPYCDEHPVYRAPQYWP